MATLIKCLEKLRVSQPIKNLELVTMVAGNKEKSMKKVYAFTKGLNNEPHDEREMLLTSLKYIREFDERKERGQYLFVEVNDLNFHSVSGTFNGQELKFEIVGEHHILFRATIPIDIIEKDNTYQLQVVNAREKFLPPMVVDGAVPAGF